MRRVIQRQEQKNKTNRKIKRAQDINNETLQDQDPGKNKNKKKNKIRKSEKHDQEQKQKQLLKNTTGGAVQTNKQTTTNYINEHNECQIENKMKISLNLAIPFKVVFHFLFLPC